MSWKQLRERVRQCAAAMRATGLNEGDRVAGFLANHTNTLVAMLAATALGAIWTGVSPDTGAHAVLERLRQIEPSLLFADNAVTYNGKTHDVQDKVLQIVRDLPTLGRVVIFDTVPSHETALDRLQIEGVTASSFNDFLAAGLQDDKLAFAQLPPDHPVYILYSSGTTGSTSRTEARRDRLTVCRTQVHRSRSHRHLDSAQEGA